MAWADYIRNEFRVEFFVDWYFRVMLTLLVFSSIFFPGKIPALILFFCFLGFTFDFFWMPLAGRVYGFWNGYRTIVDFDGADFAMFSIILAVMLSGVNGIWDLLKSTSSTPEVLAAFNALGLHGKLLILIPPLFVLIAIWRLRYPLKSKKRCPHCNKLLKK